VYWLEELSLGHLVSGGPGVESHGLPFLFGYKFWWFLLNLAAATFGGRLC
jgi:hypothetical protein